MTDQGALEPVNKGGRPRKIEKYAAVIQATDAALYDLLPSVPEALKNLIEGIWVEEQDGRGEVRTYRRPPDLGAIKILLDRTFGKATQSILIKGEIEHLLSRDESLAQGEQLDMSRFDPEEEVAMLEMILAAKKRRLENTIDAEVVLKGDETFGHAIAVGEDSSAGVNS